MSHFSIEVRRERRAVILVPSGELDLASASAIREHLERAWQSGATQVVVDLRNVQFMDSTGLHAIVGAHQHARKSGLAFGVVDGGEQVHKLLSLTRMLDTLRVGGSPEELLQG